MKAAVLGALTVIMGVAHAAGSTYTEAIEAARAQYQKGDYVSAQKTTEQAFSLAQTSSEKVDALIRLGLTYNKRKLNGQARTQWMKVLQLPQASAGEKLSAQSFIAASYGEESNWSQSRAEFQKIVDTPEATPRDKFLARSAIAGTFLNEKNEVEARNTFSTLAEDTALDANFRASAYTQIAQSFLRERGFEKARVALRSALSLTGVAPEFAVMVQAALADSYKNEGDMAKAQEEFDKAQDIALIQSKVLFKAKKFASARALLEQLLTFGKVEPGVDAGVRMEIAQIFLAESKPQQARERFQLVLEKQYGEGLTPKDAATLVAVRQSAQLGIARSYVQEQNKAQARKILQSLLAVEQLHPSVRNGAQKLFQELS